MSEKDRIQDKLLGVAVAMDTVDENRTQNALKFLRRNKDAWFATVVDLKQTQREAGFYGEVFYRAFIVDEVDEILTNPLLKKQLKDWESLTKEEHKALFEWKCEQCARVLHPKMGITKEVLIQTGNFAFVTYLFNYLTEFSGIGGNIVKDTLWFLQLPTGQGIPQTVSAPPKKTTHGDLADAISGQVIGSDYGADAT